MINDLIWAKNSNDEYQSLKIDLRLLVYVHSHTELYVKNIPSYF